MSSSARVKGHTVAATVCQMKATVLVTSQIHKNRVLHSVCSFTFIKKILSWEGFVLVCEVVFDHLLYFFSCLAAACLSFSTLFIDWICPVGVKKEASAAVPKTSILLSPDCEKKAYYRDVLSKNSLNSLYSKALPSGLFQYGVMFILYVMVPFRKKETIK